MKHSKTIFVSIMTASLVGCNTPQKEKTMDAKAEKTTEYSIQTEWMDTTTAPSDDFYQYANGTWLANNPVPSSESSWGSFNILDKENKKKLTKILDSAVTNNGEKGSDAQLIGDYYTAMKNMDVRNQQFENNVTTLQSEMDQLTSIKDFPSFIQMMNKKGMNAFFNLYVGQDLKNNDKNVLYISQGGLGLPNRDYYDDKGKAEIRKKYKAFMQQALSLFGYDNAEEIAKNAYTVEETLAKTMMKPAELRVPENTYHPYAVDKAAFLSPLVNLSSLIEKYGNEDDSTIVVEQPKHLKEVVQYIQTADFNTLKDYITWKYVNHYASKLNEELLQANFDFYGKVLSGTTEMKPINERAINEMTRMPVKTALAKAFVAQYFPEGAKEKINDLVDNLFEIYSQQIQELPWMSEATKEEALKKLNAITRKLGYPEEWKSMEGLNIVSDDYLANTNACALFSHEDNMNKLAEPVDKTEWGMPAHMVNAYYHPLLNEIAFPAGIMQAPFFDINAEDAVNYAGIGMVIGHELTHGFDDMGSKFAADGSFTNWWTEEDRANFEKRTEKLGKTFSQFCPFDSICVNPKLTMGENIADLGGIKMAYYAYTLTDEYKSGEVIDGFTPDQRFFIAYAQLWKINYTDEALKKRLATDPHSPGKYRVNGPLMNTPEFFKAFAIKEGSPMRKSKEEIAEIW